jgi:transposase InsO family protein
LLDSGASCTVLGKGSLELVKRLKLDIFEKKVNITTADGTKHSIKGFVNAPFLYDQRLKIIPTLIVPTLNQQLILGIDFWNEFNIIPYVQPPETCKTSSIHEIYVNAKPLLLETEHVLTQNQQARLAKIVETLKPSGEKIIPTHLMKHTINTGDVEPVRSRPYVYSPAIEKKVHTEIDRMLKLDVIERSHSAWRNPLVVVPKSEDRVRLCLDSRKLNSVTVRDAYVIPNLNRILGRLGGTKYLSTIDMADSFWQIGLEEASKAKTAFSVPGRGLYQFKVLPFGLSNSAQCLGRLMDIVLETDLEPRVFVYVDDIVICSNDLEEHLELIKTVSERLVKAGLRANLEKSHFCRKELKYLGYILDESGLRTDPEKVAAVVNFPAPKTLRELRRFIGMCGWYRRFIEDFATLIAPMSELLKTKHGTEKGSAKKDGENKHNHKFTWTAEADVAFRKAKEVLVSAPVLVNPNYEKPFIIHADASDYGIGGVLSQEQEGGGEKPCAFFSLKLTSTQRKYTTTEKECMAVLLSVENFRPYIDGTKFTVVTDHSALLWLLKLKTPPSARLSRWILRIQGFDFEIVHRKGKEHVVPDALSRALNPTEDVDELDIESETTDEWYNALKVKIIKHSEKYPDFRVDDENIMKYCRRKNDFGDQDFIWKIIVPADKRKPILEKSHDECGHLGVFKTTNRIKQRYYWPRMQNDVEAYIRNCEPCKSSKDIRTVQKPPMGQPKHATEPWQVVSMDFVGKFPRSTQQNTQLLVIYDWYSKYVIAKPMRAALSQKLCDFLEYDVFLTYGVPQHIISDNGSQFTSKQFQSLLRKYDINHMPNARYHSQFNPAERVNGMIGSSIRCQLGPDHRKWDQNLKKITYAINTSVNAVTKVTPHYLNFGKELKISGDEYRQKDSSDVEKYAKEKVEDLRKAKDFVVKQMQDSHERTKKRYDLRTREVTYKPGDVVWRTNFQLSDASKDYCAKLGKRRVKCIVIRKVGTSCYELSNFSGKSLGIFHAKDMCQN